jgi:hypothetical protein
MKEEWPNINTAIRFGSNNIPVISRKFINSDNAKITINNTNPINAPAKGRGNPNNFGSVVGSLFSLPDRDSFMFVVP